MADNQQQLKPTYRLHSIWQLCCMRLCDYVVSATGTRSVTHIFHFILFVSSVLSSV